MKQDLPVKTDPSEQGPAASAQEKENPFCQKSLISSKQQEGTSPFIFSQDVSGQGPEVTARSRGHRLPGTLVRGAGHLRGPFRLLAGCAPCCF